MQINSHTINNNIHSVSLENDTNFTAVGNNDTANTYVLMLQTRCAGVTLAMTSVTASRNQSSHFPINFQYTCKNVHSTI